MKLKRPNITSGDWQVYTMQSSSGHTVRGRFVQVVHHDSVSRVAEIPADSPENQTAIASLPKLLEALEFAYKSALAWCYDENPHGDLNPGDSPGYDAACIFRDSMQTALLAAGYTEPKTP